MWAATVSFPSISNLRGPILPNNRTDGSKRPSLNFRASFSDYPLASRLLVRTSLNFEGSNLNSMRVVLRREDLPYSTKESRLQEEFSNFGEIAEVLLAKDQLTKRPKGYAFIQYTCQDDAMLALENMDCKKFDGRMIYVELAKPGSSSFGGYPRTSGPPKERPKVELQEVADCWY
ncbi:organelle RRM domain-containing protein 6, chloroplastic isoform X3 [Benincasa hispida]|uniref:organelle RRM domain-containing protein 6, chloroplastic isoform X3 n=1 Tax=Benincasa hispida TaxID=102211 RepID=UPI0019019F03|nr:organelle RRM domain-containing protein 6, chloroplastic isoform X3 [Benincasa hispida]